MMTKEGSTNIVNLIIPGAGSLVLGHGQIGKIQYYVSSSCLHGITDQTNEVYSNYDQDRVYQYFKFHDPGALVIFLLWRGHVSHYSEYLLAEFTPRMRKIGV